MKGNLESDTYNNEFFQWLKSDSMIFKGQNELKYTFIKYPYSKKLDIIYESRLDDIGIGGNLSYCGIYDKEKVKLIVTDYYLDLALGSNWDDVLYKNKYELEDKLLSNLKICVENYVSQNPDEFYETVKDYGGYCNKNKVERDFVNGCEHYEYEANIHDLSYRDILKCLDDENYIFDIASDYMQRHMENIGRQLKDNDEENEYLTSIINNKNHDLYKAREINDILKNSSALNLHLYIRKNGINVDFKYDKDILVNSLTNSYISLYGMPASDRRKFRNLFDNNDDFNYKDICKIEYRNKSLYVDKNYDNILEKDEYSL